MKKFPHFLTGILAAVISLSLLPAPDTSAEKLTESGGLKYAVQENGDMSLYTGWVQNTSTGKYYYYKDGKKLRQCWLAVKGEKRFYLTDDGSAATGKVTLSGTEYEFDSRGRLVPDKWNITTEAADVSAASVTVITTVDSGSHRGEYTYGTYFTAQRLSDGGWETLPPVNDVVFTDIEYIYDVGRNTEEYRLDLIYGALPGGRYRICHDITKYSGDDRHRETKTYYTYFTLE